MDRNQKETNIQTYFSMWVKRDFTLLEPIFSEDIFYSECYGPEYQGLSELRLWIEEMTQKQQVLQWRIKGFLHEGNTVVTEWFFEERMEGKISGFDGVSIIEFRGDGKISSIKEFGSKAEHHTPYR